MPNADFYVPGKKLNVESVFESREALEKYSIQTQKALDASTKEVHRQMQPTPEQREYERNHVIG